MNLTIGRKLAFGFGLLTLIGIIVGGVGQYSLVLVSNMTTTLSNYTHNAQIGSDAQSNLNTLRLVTKSFLLTEDEAEYRRYQDLLLSFNEKLATAQQEITDPKRTSELKQIKSKTLDYSATFEQVHTLALERQGLVANKLRPMGNELRIRLKQHKDQLAEKKLYEPAVFFADTTNELMLARYYARTYIEDGNRKTYDRAILEVGNFLNKMQLATMEDLEENEEFLEYTLATIAEYERDLNRVRDITEMQQELIATKLDVLGPEIVEHWHNIVESLDTDTTVMSVHAVESAQQKATILTIALIAEAIFAVVLSIFITRSITLPLNKTAEAMINIAEGDGDLTVRLDEQRKDELGSLARGFNRFASKVHDLVASVRGASNEVASASTEIAATSEHISGGLEKQQHQVGLIASAAEQMSVSVSDVSDQATNGLEQARKAGDMANTGGNVVRQTIEDMHEISEAVKATAACVEDLGRRGEQIGAIIEVINDIADQTNLLALNAAIEAARAGEHGRGFAVVADEVRKLADRTTNATEEIAGSIEAIQSGTSTAVERMKAGTDRVNQGVSRATEAGDSLSAIQASSLEVCKLVETIATASREQSSASQGVTTSVTEISSVIASSAAGSKQAADATTMLSQKAEQLSSLIRKFKLKAIDRRVNEGVVPQHIQDRRIDVMSTGIKLMEAQGLDSSEFRKRTKLVDETVLTQAKEDPNARYRKAEKTSKKDKKK